MNYVRVDVEVIVRITRTGRVIPLKIVWEDGREFEIERVTFFEKTASRVGAVLPVRYTCRVRGSERFLYCESGTNIWFLEREMPG